MSRQHCDKPQSTASCQKDRPWFHGKFDIEEGGIERVTDDQRQQDTTKFWNAATFWFSANMAVATLNIGSLGGGSLGLGFWDCFIIILIVNLLSDLLSAWTAIVGLTGLRMTTFSCVIVSSLPNFIIIIPQANNLILVNDTRLDTGATCLSSSSQWLQPQGGTQSTPSQEPWCSTLCPTGGSQLGPGWIHRLVTYIWIPPLIVWCVAAGTGASSFTGARSKHLEGANKAAAVLTYMASIFSFSVSWVNCAADYNVRMPANTPQGKIFSATYIGIFVPTVLVQILGAARYSGVVTSTRWKDAHASCSIGGLLQMSLEPAGGFGKFLMVLAALSAIVVMRIPRIILVTFGFIVSIIVGCFAAMYFDSTLSTLLSVIGYWTVIHITVVMEEHFIFRHGWKTYDWDAWNSPTGLPFRWAAIGAFAFGFNGAALEMKVTWYA
ncbi:uncharacterized protein N7477_004633, partial [Penicillium maclennaniae]|uniref:uncharacterized protein n=1 Tax=Penicillium maclennaniae TaxID=1343394 RepID=UPI002541EAD9